MKICFAAGSAPAFAWLCCGLCASIRLRELSRAACEKLVRHVLGKELPPATSRS
jgi:hypothetical protein